MTHLHKRLYVVLFSPHYANASPEKVCITIQIHRYIIYLTVVFCQYLTSQILNVSSALNCVGNRQFLSDGLTAVRAGIYECNEIPRYIICTEKLSVKNEKMCVKVLAIFTHMVYNSFSREGNGGEKTSRKKIS